MVPSRRELSSLKADEGNDQQVYNRRAEHFVGILTRHAMIPKELFHKAKRWASDATHIALKEKFHSSEERAARKVNGINQTALSEKSCYGALTYMFF